MNHAIVGTAGHIDHGKTALVRALTGTDTDRLAEERRRGISIDLGFARLDLDEKRSIGVVDVPGHERFLRNMLAGAHGFDLVLLVVAADDGVMPQTEEHFEIVHLLGVTRGVVAMTKIDLVDDARVEEVREEIEILTAGTMLEAAPVVPVSSVTGEGLETLRCEISACLDASHASRSAESFRLPIDRVFTVTGHGTVVTGTAISGRVAPGDSLMILPGELAARVRGIQVHGSEVAEASWGERVALNLAGVERHSISRGAVALSPEIAGETDRFDARIEVRPLAGGALPVRSRVRIHAGTTEVLGRLVLLGGIPELVPRQSGWAQIVCDSPVAVFRGDRFVLRSETADRILGGGEVVHPSPPTHRANDARVPDLLARIGSTDVETAVVAFLEMDRELTRSPTEIAAALGRPPAEIVRPDAIESDEGPLVPLPSEDRVEAVTTRSKWKRWLDALVETLDAEHHARPLEPGIEMELVRSRLPGDLSSRLYRSIIDQLAAQETIVREGSLIRLPSHTSDLDAEESRIGDSLVAALERSPFAPPALSELASAAGTEVERARSLLTALERSDRVARVSKDMFFASSALRKIRDLVVDGVRNRGPISAAEFRDLIGATRKHAIPLLEYLDRSGLTIRVGDRRTLRKG